MFPLCNSIVVPDFPNMNVDITLNAAQDAVNG